MTPSAARDKFVPSKSDPGPVPSADDRIACSPVTALARWIETRKLTSERLTQIYLSRIERLDPKINAFVTLIEEQAMAQAKHADQLNGLKKNSGKSSGKLHGLPVVVKDSFATAGVRTTCGSKQLEKYVPKDDAVVVARLKSAGAIIIGKTNLPEFAGDWQSYNQVAGVTNNPWDVSRTPGGSTGGGAAIG